MNTSRHRVFLQGKWIDRPLAIHLLSEIPRQDSLVHDALTFFMEWTSESETLLLRTSGSTGPPKKVEVSKQSMIISARSTIDYFGLQKHEKALLCLSPDYIAGKMMIVRAILAEMELIIASTTANPLTMLEESINFAAMVPLQLSKVLGQSPEKLDLIQKLIIGGSSIDAKLEKQLKEVKTRCYHSYGMTETLSHIALRALNGEAASDVFQALNHVQIATDERGCLTLTSPQLFEGVLVTNDLAQLTDSRHFRVLGRADEVIISAGNKLHPAAIEQKISDLFHKNIVISSIPDSLAGEIVVLYCEENFSIQAVWQLWENLEKRLTPTEMPRKIIPSVAIPLLESGKINRLAIGRQLVR